MKHLRMSLFYGFVIFAMFFGSGNLVLPLQIGSVSGENWIFGFAGLCLTGVLLPFLGFVVVKFHNGNYKDFFADAGIIAKTLLVFLILCLIGPFGVIPRCIVVAHGGIQYLFPNISLISFSAVFSLIIFAMCLKDKIMLKVLGKILSPIKLIALSSLVFFGVYGDTNNLSKTDAFENFTNGAFTAYQTMDLFAAFLFSSVIFKQIQDSRAQGYIKSDKDVLLISVSSGIFGFFLLAIIYLGLVFLGSHYSFLLHDVPPQKMLPTIAMHSMGNMAVIFISITMFFSCLATAVALSNVYAKYLCEDVFRMEQKKFYVALLVTIFIAFILSLLDFSGITALLVPPLEVSYPGVIALTVMCIIYKRPSKIKIYVFWLITTMSIINVF